MNRLSIVPDARHEALGAELRPRLAAIAREITSSNLSHIIGDHTLAILDSIAVGDPADLFVWARAGGAYGCAWVGKGGEDFQKTAAQVDVDEGMIAKVFESGRSDTALAADLDLSEWSNLPQLLGKELFAMSASPVVVFGSCVAVISRMAFINGEKLQPPAGTASLLARLIEDRLIRMTLGLESI